MWYKSEYPQEAVGCCRAQKDDAMELWIGNVSMGGRVHMDG